MSEILDRLKDGVRHFRQHVYEPNAATYQHAASTPQKPHTLVIACADSRVDVEKITNARPGEVFITRNIGNMVPAYGETQGAVAAVIEYAVSALGVKHVVICGHSDCGAMKALLHPEAAASMPAVKSWLANAKNALPQAESLQRQDSRELLPVLTEQNVLLQLEQLKTHPAVAGALERGELTVSGWVYEIGSGEVRIAEQESHAFRNVSAAAAEVVLES